MGRLGKRPLALPLGGGAGASCGCRIYVLVRFARVAVDAGRGEAESGRVGVEHTQPVERAVDEVAAHGRLDAGSHPNRPGHRAVEEPIQHFADEVALLLLPEDQVPGDSQRRALRVLPPGLEIDR